MWTSIHLKTNLIDPRIKVNASLLKLAGKTYIIHLRSSHELFLPNLPMQRSKLEVFPISNIEHFYIFQKRSNLAIFFRENH